ncbi:hypothetical protein BKA64DRAFT_448825 [Cadophora sp. MPI-SDFR-AT-0126]|nr:hypothetical protein BKA64DRAFT_448825 [Leotiomycetes sp. MPI-SDFR-AT-0126]
MSPKRVEDRSIILTSTTGEKSIWRPRENIPSDEVRDTVAAARILNAKTPKIKDPEASGKSDKKRKKEQWWRKLWEKMTKQRKVQVLETGVDTFPAHKPTLLERVIEFWKPVPGSSPPQYFSSRLDFPASGPKDKERPKDRAAAAAAATTRSRLPSKFHEFTGYMSSDLSKNMSREKDICKLPLSSSAATSLLELGTLPGGGALNPLAGPSTQRARSVHDRAKGLIASSEVPSPAASSKVQMKPQRRRDGKNTIETHKKEPNWGWLSCCTKSENECDCDNHGQVNQGRVDGECLIKMSSEDSLVNVTFDDKPILSPDLFKIADIDKITDLEDENQHKNTFEVTKVNNSRQHNMVKGKIEVAKAGSVKSTSVPSAVPAAPVLTPFTARPQSPDRVPALSLAQRLKALKEKHASKSGNTFEIVWEGGGQGRVQGPAGTMRGESEVENGFVEVDIPASNNTDPKTSHVVAAGSRVRYLPAALEDAIKTELPKPTKEEVALAVGVHLDASSTGGSFKTARTSASTASTASKVTPPTGPTVNNSTSTKQLVVSAVSSSSRARSAPLMKPTTSSSKPTGRSVSKTTVSSGADDSDDPRRSAPINIKKPSKTSDMNESYFQVRSQDGTDTGYPALDSSATSSDFDFHSTIVPGSWPDDEDSEWVDGKEEFEAVMREKGDMSKIAKKH